MQQENNPIVSLGTESEDKQQETPSAPQPQAGEHYFLYNTLAAFLSKKNVKTLADHICKVYADLLLVREAALFLQEEDSYRIRGSYGIRGKQSRSVSLSPRSPFVTKLKGFKKVLIFKQQGDFSLEEFQILYLRKALSRFVLDYVVLLKDQHGFLGFITLGRQNNASSSSLNNDTQQLITHISTQATAVLQQKIFYEQFQAVEQELRQSKHMKNYLLEHISEGVMMIDYAARKIQYVNGSMSKLLVGEGDGSTKKFSVQGKKIEEIMEKFPDHPFSKFLHAYKEARAARRSLKKPLIYEYKVEATGAAFAVNSAFIKGGAGTRGVELIVVGRK